MSRPLRVVLDPPLGECGVNKENHNYVDLDCQFESRECYDWFVKFVEDRMVMAERWEDGQEG